MLNVGKRAKLGTSRQTLIKTRLNDEFKRGIIRLPAKHFEFDGTRYKLNRMEGERMVYYFDCLPRREHDDAVFDVSFVRASYFMKD